MNFDNRLDELAIVLPKVGDPMIAREATLKDVDRLAEWNHHLIRDEGHRNPMTQSQLAERMRGWLAGEYRATIFETENMPVAHALFREQSDEIYLRQFFVVEKHRRRGIGKRAVSMLQEAWPSEKRLTVEVLTVNAAAVSFWRGVGYSDYSITMEIEAET